MTAGTPHRHPIATLLATLLVFIPSLGAAASADAGVAVEILPPVLIQTQQSMNFGGVVPPTSGSQTFELDPNSAQLSAGEGDGSTAGEAVLATFAVSGAANRSLNASAAVTQDFADPSLSLSDLSLAGSAALDGSGQGMLSLGGRLTVAAGASQGDHGDAVITVTVSYE